MSALPIPFPVVPRKPPTAAQYNWVTERYDIPPEQLDLGLPPPDDLILPRDETVTLLQTESGSQLFVSGFGLYIGKKSERIVVTHRKETVAQVPMMRVQEIIAASKGVSLSTDLIQELCERGIRVGFLTSSGKPYALLTSPMLTATVETRRAQLAAFAAPEGADLCRWIVAGKLHNQEKLLLYYAKSRTGHGAERLTETAASLRKLRKSAIAVEGDSTDQVRATLLGLEGTGGRIYWDRVADMLPEGSGFDGREKRGAQDAVNAALNYGYGILQAHVWGAVMNAGMEPFAGFMHVDRGGRPSLVLDLMEEFRQPVVDRPLLSWLNKGGSLRMEKGLLDGPSREAVASRVLVRMNAVEPHRGKQHQVRSIIQMQARLAAMAVRGLRNYRPFSFKW